MQYIPGSHRCGLLDKPSLSGEMKGPAQFLNKEQASALEQPIPIEMEQGYATFHHPILVHGSFENLSERPRRTYEINVFADGTSSDTNDSLLEGVPIVPKAAKWMENSFLSCTLCSILT